MFYQDHLFRGLAVLCGTHQPSFDEESYLRQFQFKMWLRTDQWPADCVLQSGKLYAAIRITVAMETDPGLLMSRGGYKTSPTYALVKAVRQYKDLVDVTFTQRDFTGIPGKRDYAAIVEHAEADLREIDDLNALTYWRMRIANTDDLKPTENRGWLAYEAFEQTKGSRTGRTVLREVLARREARVPFLFVAHHTLPGLLTIEEKLDDEMAISDENITNEQWRSYIEGVLHVMQKLGEGEHERLSQATGLTAKAWTSFNELDKKELDTAGIKPDGRRSASQTKKAQRLGRKTPT